MHYACTSQARNSLLIFACVKFCLVPSLYGVFSSCFLSDKIYNLHFESAIYLVRFAIVISKCKKATAAFKYIVTEIMECATSETGTDPGNT